MGVETQLLWTSGIIMIILITQLCTSNYVGNSRYHNSQKTENPYEYGWPYHWVDTTNPSSMTFHPAIKVLLPSYNVTESYDSSTCRGEVFIKLHDDECKRISSQKISHNTTWDSYLKRVYGPDHYRLMYEGAEKIMAIQHTENCTTRLFYSFTLPGEYKPHIIVELSEYWGVNEVVHNTAHWNKQQLALLRTRRCGTTSEYEQNGKKVIAGRWVRKTAFPTLPFPEETKLGSDWSWHRYKDPITMPRVRLGREQGLRCLHRLRISSIELRGDSQSRSVYQVLEERLLGAASGSVFQVRGRKKTDIDGIHLISEPDNYLQFSTSVSDTDIVLTGTGPHPGSWGQWTFTRFEHEMHAIADALCARNSTTMWHGSPAWPKGKNKNGFRATNPRLHIFNKLAKQVLLETCADKIHFIDFYEMTITQLELSLDGGHYHETVVLDAVVDEFLDIICST